MRHGSRDTSGPKNPQLGCYFCNDVVAPADVCHLPSIVLRNGRRPDPIESFALVIDGPHPRPDVHSYPAWAGEHCLVQRRRASRLPSSAPSAARTIFCRVHHTANIDPLILATKPRLLLHTEHRSIGRMNRLRKSRVSWDSCRISCADLYRNSTIF